MAELTKTLYEVFTPSLGEFNIRVTGGAAELQCKLAADSLWSKVQVLNNDSAVIDNVVDGMTYRFIDKQIGTPQVFANQSASAVSGGSGGGSSSVSSVGGGIIGVDSNGTQWLLLADKTTTPVTVSYVKVSDGTVGTPVGGFQPDSDVTEIVDSVEIVKHHECPVEPVTQQ